MATQSRTSSRDRCGRNATTNTVSSTSSGASITVMPTTVDERDGVPAQVEEYARKGYTVYREWATPAETAAATIQALTTAMTKPKGVLVHTEETAHGTVVPARIEKISVVSGEVADMCAKAMRIAERTTGRKLRMFKDKINFKFPGGGGFLAHQDSPAYFPHGSWHVSVAVALTDFTVANGTIDFADTLDHAPPMEDLVDLDYTTVELKAGDCVVFGGLVPHRSGANTTDRPRIGLYLTFTDYAEGDCMASYYAAKVGLINAAGITGLSLNQVDFTGKLVSDDHTTGGMRSYHVAGH